MEATTQPKERALTPVQQKAKTIQSYLASRAGAFSQLLPKHLTPEKMVKGVMAAATRNPRILECTQGSILNAVLVASQLGLEIGQSRGGMHLVPFRNSKIGGYEVVAIPDYRGLIGLAYNSGKVLNIQPYPVYDEDDFEFAYGTETYVKHTPKLTGRGNLKCVYAVAHLRDLKPVFVVMSLDEVNAHRDRSRAKGDGPWVTDYTAMALKTVVKALVNWLPQSADDRLQRAVEYDNRADAGDAREAMAELFGDVIEVESEPVVEQSRSEQATAVLRQKQQEQTGGAAPANSPSSPKGQGEPPVSHRSTGDGAPDAGAPPAAPVGQTGPYPDAPPVEPPTALAGKQGATSKEFKGFWRALHKAHSEGYGDVLMDEGQEGLVALHVSEQKALKDEHVRLSKANAAQAEML